MKILHYIPSIDRSSGGTTAYMQLLGKAMGQMLDLHIATHVSANEVEIANCTIHYLEPSLLGGLKKDWQNLLNKLTPELVHVNCCWMPQCAFTQKWAQRMGYKVVLSPHGMLEPWIMARNYWTKKLPAMLLYQKSAIVKADYLHATAASEKNNLLALGYNSNIAIVPNGIETEALLPKTEWRAVKRVLFLSRVHPKKGLELLIDAVSHIDASGVEFIIAGEGDAEYINQLQTKIANKGLSSSIKIIGGVYGNAKWELYRDADLFVLPTYSENFGIVVAEALYTGLPVITTTGTPWEELNSEGCGWWIELSVENLVQTLKVAFALDKENLQTMGLKGRRLVEDRYDITKVAKDMKQLYEQILNK